MKSNSISFLLLVFVLFFSSCREIEIKTSVHADGSFTRIITITGDSTEVVKGGLPYPVDSSWSKQLTGDSSDSTKYICIYTKDYPSDDELNMELDADTAWRKSIERETQITKRFMFFYSFITYREVYKPIFPSDHVNYRDYLTDDEISLLTGSRMAVSKQDSIQLDALENKLENYLYDAVTAQIIEDLNEGLSRLNKTNLLYLDVGLYNDSIKSKVDEFTNDDMDNYIKSLAVWSGEKDVLMLLELQPPVFESLNKRIEKFDNILEMEDFIMHIEMPGLLTATTSNTVLGNRVSWSVGTNSFLFDDFEMMAESRVINYWAFVVSGIVVLLLLISLIVKLFR